LKSCHARIIRDSTSGEKKEVCVTTRTLREVLAELFFRGGGWLHGRRVFDVEFLDHRAGVPVSFREFQQLREKGIVVIRNALGFFGQPLALLE
jgi:hypothetical protein